MFVTREQIVEASKTGALAGLRLRRALPRKTCLRVPTPGDVELVREHIGEDAAKGRVVPFIASTEERARDDHTIRAAGWKLERYADTPVVLWSHDRKLMRVGDGVAAVDGNVLRNIVSFLPRDLSEFAYQTGEVAATRGHAGSVGFDILKARAAPQDVLERAPWALDIDEAELLEFSMVNVPADPGALAGREDLDRPRLSKELDALLEAMPAAERGSLLELFELVARDRKRFHVVDRQIESIRGACSAQLVRA